MTEHAFDTLARSLGRRRAVQALAAAAATTLSGVALTGAKSNNGKQNKKQKQKKKKQAKKIDEQSLALCAGQVAQCEALVGAGSPQLICCRELADCDFGGLIACLTVQVNT